MRGIDFPVGDMCWRRAFLGVPAEARAAREFVGFLVQGMQRADDVVLATSELVANTLQHTRSGLPGGLFVVEVRRWRRGAALTVIDQGGPHDPVPRSPLESGGAGLPLCDLAESGRGLLTIEATASWWDWCGGPNGRTVTAVYYERPRLHQVARSPVAV